MTSTPASATRDRGRALPGPALPGPNRHHLVLACEGGAVYDADAGDDGDAGGDGAAPTPPEAIPPALARLSDLPVPEDPMDPSPIDDLDAHPFGLPVLSEVPQLAMLLQDLRKVDRLLADVIDAILELEDSGLTEATTGLGIDTWLTIVGRRTGADARMLRTTATIMRRAPSLHTAFQAGHVSWAQVRSVVLAVRPLPRSFDEVIDAAIADSVNSGGSSAEPDALTRTIRWHLASIDPTRTERDQADAEQAEYLAMQPRLDGTGGRIWGDLGPTNFAILDSALNLGPTGECDRVVDGDSHGDGHGDGPQDSEVGEHPIRVAGRDRLRRLMHHLERSLDSRLPGDPSGTPAHRATSRPMRSRPQLLLRTDLSTLLDRDQTPAALLTTLLGGHVRVTAETARLLVDRRGAHLRTVILDDTGAVVGVGRRTRVPPDWLADATLALHDTCTHPGCEKAARVSETDHACPWHRVRPDDPAGRTDIDELGPGCKHHNHTKEAAGWVVTQQPDGTRRWHHPRSGVTTRTHPVPTAPSTRSPTHHPTRPSEEPP